MNGKGKQIEGVHVLPDLVALNKKTEVHGIVCIKCTFLSNAPCNAEQSN